MTVRALVTQGFHYARTCKSLWLFGFFVGIASGGSTGGSQGGGDAAAGGGLPAGVSVLELARLAGAPFGLSIAAIGLLVLALLTVVAAAILMRFVSEGALIEGVVRARRGGALTMREGFRAGWAHWGVLVRITVIYFAVTIVSLVVLAAPCVLALRAIGPVGGIVLGIPALVIAVPWLVTIYLVQAFASRIAVLEHRHALDAIAKARLFLHGRLKLGLKIIVAMFVGTLAIVVAGIVTLVPVGLLLAALIPVIRLAPVIVIGCLVIVPAIAVLAAMVGMLRSSVWTIGYLTQVES